MIQRIAVLAILFSTHVFAETIRVPLNHPTIQAAIDTAKPGDVVLVDAGTYVERVTLRPGITLRSAGDNTKGKVGLARAEATIIDGGGAKGDTPGIKLAEKCTVDGFTITNVGVYDKTIWQQHFDSNGEELGDDEGSVQAEGTVPGVQIINVNCVVTNNVVHHNGDVGIAISGDATRPTHQRIENNISYRNMGAGIGIAIDAQPIVTNNTCNENLRAGIGCRRCNPIIIDNYCFGNVRAGIGCREGAKPIIRGNQCHRNRRAGIGVRMKGTAPVVESNECLENEMAGIGNRDGASPIIRDNRCCKNKLAGIGSDGSNPIIRNNQCIENMTAGIGIRGGTHATVAGNHCRENKLVAIGVIQGSTATIVDNELIRTGSMPPIIAVKDHSTATIQRNQIHGGGVAAILVQGTASIHDNIFHGKGEKQGNAIWVWKESEVLVSQNWIEGYRAGVNATQSKVSITNNTIKNFRDAALVVKDSTQPAHIQGNTAISNDKKATVWQIQGPVGTVSNNNVKRDDSNE